MTLYCDSNLCIFWQEGQCQRDELTLYDGECGEYQDITEGPDYNEEYFIACEHRPKDGGEPIRYRKMRRGKAYTHDGMIFYTQDDIRFGISGATFTEGYTGYLCKGDDLLNEDSMKRILETRKICPPVMSLPWMDDSNDGTPVPHEEKTP